MSDIRPMSSNDQTTPQVNQSERILDLEDKFIQIWGEISLLWGVARSIGRIHALLFISDRPLAAEEIAQRLQISHGNCSTSLRELIGWQVIRRVHPAGERKAFYESEEDGWTWFHRCIRERKRREIMPVIAQLHEVETYAAQATEDAAPGEAARIAHVRDRVESFARFTDEFMDLIDAFLSVGHGPLGKALRSIAKLMPKRNME